MPASRNTPVATDQTPTISAPSGESMRWTPSGTLINSSDGLRLQCAGTPVIDAPISSPTGIVLNGLATHWDPATPSADGIELVGLRLFADALFDLVVVNRIDLEPDALQRVVTAHRAKQVAYWLDRALDQSP